LDAGDVAGAVRRLLSLDADPTADRAAVASLIARVGELAASPRIDRAEVAGPFVDLLLQLRLAARAGRRFDEADRVRDGLAALGVEVSDTPDGATWRMP